MKSILITGGARSGKSRYAQELAHRSPQPVLFVATAQAGDDEMKRRIEAHQRERPSGWTTIETPLDVGRSTRQNIGGARTVLVDCVTLLVSNIIGKAGAAAPSQIEEEVSREISELIQVIQESSASFIIVTNEVGLGLVPDNPLGRLYRDLLGKANQMLAAQASEVYFMVSGLPLAVKPPRYIRLPGRPGASPSV